MVSATIAGSSDRSRHFYAWMTTGLLALAVIGFTPTFLVPVALGTLPRAPMSYAHGLVFFAWTAFLCTQSWLAARGRIVAHREWGVLGAAIAALMPFTVLTVTIARLNMPHIVAPQGPMTWPEMAQRACAEVAQLTYFETCVIAALANVRRPEVHKRLLLMATIPFMNAPIGRLIGAMVGPPPAGAGVSMPIVVAIFGSLSLLLVVVPMIYDWRSRGRISRIYLIGAPVFLATAVTSNLVGISPAWQAVARWMQHYAG